MAVCVYFQQGRCRYGDRCKNEHPGHFTTGASANRFSVLGTGTSAAGNAGINQRQQDKSDNFHVNAEGIQLDLTAGKERPEWIFSAYGPGKNAPRQLFGGPSREQSFEEMRLRHYEAGAAGNANVAIQESQRLHDETLNQIQTILNDLNGAVKYVLDGLNEHPNRIDICEGKKPIPSAFTQQTAAPSAPSTAFGKPSALGTTAPAASFGKPSMLGAAQNKPAFGQPSFGKPSFGQPSLGQPSLGQPSLGQPSLGQPSLGQPSFGQPSFGQPAFGRPSMPGGSTTANPSPFAQPSQPNPLAAGRFNQPLAPSPFGQAASGQATTSPFSSIASQSAGTSVFGAPSSTAVVSEQPSQAPSAFGQRQPAPQPSPFGPTTVVSATPSVFGQPTSTTAAPVQPATNVTARAPLGPKPIIQVGPGELNPIPDLAGDTVRDPMTQRIIRWKGRPVEYKDGVPRYLHPSDNKTWVRIFFYDGPPELATLRDCSDRDENYTQEVIAQYQYFVQNGVFKDGIVPSVPPKTEWVSFDF